MISKSTRVIALVLCLWIGAIAGIADNAEPSGQPTVAASPSASQGIRIEGRSDLHVGRSAQRPGRSQANW